MDILPVGRFFQLGYVTRDLDAAIELWRHRYGVREFRRFDGGEVRFALAWDGATMIEFIEPAAEQPGIFGEALHADRAVSLHHLGYWVDADQFDALPETCRAASLDCPIQWKTDQLSVFFADTRADNGLFSEFIHVPDMRVGLFSDVPHNVR